MLSGTLSSATSSSRVSQFGLYRSIDARTDDFLKLSRKRQIRQGCICASISTIITVTIVIVILLIYEYAIAVESSLVQTMRRSAKNSTRNDRPIAIGLHRSYFGFDQDYFERMPLLVNALQDTSVSEPNSGEITDNRKGKYIKPTTSTNLKHMPAIRRTSPRPFIFEYKSPTPTPFRKPYNSKSWIESYRNAQRLKNLQQIIKYLESTINAKFGDTESSSTTARVAFSGLLLEPVVKPDPSSPTIDLIMKSTHKADISRSNYPSDPLYTYKPASPGDVNMLADGFLRFSPSSAVNILKEKVSHKLPMFVPIANRKRYCMNGSCDQKTEPNLVFKLKNSEDEINTEASTLDKMKSYSVMLNLFPMSVTEPTTIKDQDHTKSSSSLDLSSIYFTTLRPQPAFQLKRKTNIPVKRKSSRYSRPRTFQHRDSNVHDHVENFSNSNTDGHNNKTSLILHINVYNVNETKSANNLTDATRNVHISEEAISYGSNGVQEFHVGSSGVVPVELRTSTPSTTSTTTASISTPPTITTSMTPFFDTTVTTTELGWPTNPPDLVKFSQEDAKVPDEYRHYWENREERYRYTTEFNRRTSTADVEYEDEENETSTLSIKLQNDSDVTETTELQTEETTTEVEDSEAVETTTVQHYVPLINGHHRSVTYVPRLRNDWLKVNQDNNRKRRLEMSIRGYRRPNYTPYVEIRRNKNSSNATTT